MSGATPHASLAAAADAARSAYVAARRRFDREALAEIVGDGADGTPTMRIDRLVEDAVLDACSRCRVNVLSEEAGFVDAGAAVTMVVDPVDGSANAAAGVPLACFAGALAVDGNAVEALTVWLDTGRRWWARAGEPAPFRTSGRRALDGAAISMLRPHHATRDAWWRVAARAGRVRVLSCSTLEAVLVAEGATDGFCDAGSDTHRLVDLAAAVVTVPAAGGVVVDAAGRPITIHPDLTRRWSGVVAATGDLADDLCATICP